MRLVVGLSLVLISGCASWTGVAAARSDLYREALQAQRFPMPPSEAVYRLRARAGTSPTCERLPTGVLHCGGCTRSGCYELLEDQGATRVVTRDELSERDIATLWPLLDAASYGRATTEVKSWVDDARLQQERRFEPRWGFTGGVVAGTTFDGASASVGVRAGVRRWFDIHLLGHAALEYRFRADHELGLRLGVELGRWTPGRFWGFAGAPPASVSLFMGPVVRMPALRAGVRTGVGVHLTDIRSAPFFVEISADTFFAGESSRVVGQLTIGIGL